MPNALMEAMAIGLPCISTNCPCGGSRQLINNNKNGLLIANNDEDELYKALIKLIEDRKLCEKLSVNAKESMYDFSVENIEKKWQNFINKIVNR